MARAAAVISVPSPAIIFIATLFAILAAGVLFDEEVSVRAVGWARLPCS
jgi:hypothetical protein